MPADETLYTSKIAKPLVSRTEQLFGERGEDPTPTCERLGVSRSFMSNARKHAPSVEKIFALADYFGVSTDYLLGRTDSMAAPARSAEDPTLTSIWESCEKLNQEGREELAKQARLLVASGEYIKTSSSGLVEGQI